MRGAGTFFFPSPLYLDRFGSLCQNCSERSCPFPLFFPLSALPPPPRTLSARAAAPSDASPPVPLPPQRSQKPAEASRQQLPGFFPEGNVAKALSHSPLQTWCPPPCSTELFRGLRPPELGLYQCLRSERGSLLDRGFWVLRDLSLKIVLSRKKFFSLRFNIYFPDLEVNIAVIKTLFLSDITSSSTLQELFSWDCSPHFSFGYF